jgi:putative DNA primase/helicase
VTAGEGLARALVEAYEADPAAPFPAELLVDTWQLGAGTTSFMRALADRSTAAYAKFAEEREAHRPVGVTESWALRPTDTNHLTDLGNGRRLADRIVDRFCYVAQRGWLVFDGGRWADDVHGRITEEAKAVALELLRSAADVEEPEERRRRVTWAMKSQGEPRIAAMIRLARSEPLISVSAGEFDADPWLLNAKNGTVDLRTGELHPHRPGDRCIHMAGANYRPELGDPPLFTRFLEEVLPDPDLREYVARLIGYSTTGLTTEQVLPIAWGSGANGKSVLVEILSRALGTYADVAEPDLLLARPNAHLTGVAKLQGRRFVVASESDDGRRLAEATVKRLTGGDRLTARYMGKDFFEFTPTHQIWLVTNHKPAVRGTDHGIWRRLKLLPFTVTVPPARQDPRLLDKLDDELDAILGWAVRACRRWATKGLGESLEVASATESYRAASDVLGAFLADCCVVAPGAGPVAAGDLHDAYVMWASTNGEEPMSQRALGPALTERGFERRKHGASRRWHWFGVGLLAADREGVNP